MSPERSCTVPSDRTYTPATDIRFLFDLNLQAVLEVTMLLTVRSSKNCTDHTENMPLNRLKLRISKSSKEDYKCIHVLCVLQIPVTVCLHSVFGLILSSMFQRCSGCRAGPLQGRDVEPTNCDQYHFTGCRIRSSSRGHHSIAQQWLT